MRKILHLLAAVLLLPWQLAAQNDISYCNPGGNLMSNIALTDITVSDITSGQSLEITGIKYNIMHARYQDFTSKVLTVEPGDQIYVKGGNTYSKTQYMAAFVFVDWNRNGFSAEEVAVQDNHAALEGNDLVTYNSYTINGTHYNALGYTAKSPDETNTDTETESRYGGSSKLPEFTVPLYASGDYRARYVVANNANPCDGSSNCYYIIDFTIHVNIPSLENERKITVKAEEGGSVAIISPETADKFITTNQKDVVVKATPDETHAFKNWTNDQEEEVATTAIYSYSGEDDITLTAHFGCSVNYTVGTSGSVNITSNGNQVNNGDILDTNAEVLITTIPDLGMQANVTVNSVPVQLKDNSYSFTLKQNTTIKVTFSVRPNMLIYDVVGEGSVECWKDDPDDGEQLSNNSLLPFDMEGLHIIFTPTEGWVFDAEKTTLNVGGKPYEEYVPEENPWEQDGHYEAYFPAPFAGDIELHAVFTNPDGIESTVIDPNDGPVEYYTLQGVKVAVNKQLEPGIYIARQGKKVTKVLVMKK